MATKVLQPSEPSEGVKSGSDLGIFPKIPKYLQIWEYCILKPCIITHSLRSRLQNIGQ